MPTTSENNKRIAKNTAFLYVRMLIMAVVGLFTSRIVLDALGAADYGLNNVIGGVIVLFSFLNAAMLSATQRFLNFYLGKNDMEKVNKVFCMSMNIYILLSVLAVILGETVGLWFVNTYLNIPPDRMWAAQWVYQFTILQFVVNMLRIPYNASIIAYEKMSFYAYMSIVDVVAKLIVVYLLYVTPLDRLITYSLFYTLIPIVLLFIFKIYCSRNFTTTRFKREWDKSMFREMFSFSGWQLVNGLSNVLSTQGLNILLNMFHGVVLNAAAGVANQVSAHVFAFVTNFMVAFQPQIVKTYAANEIQQLHRLIFRTSKFSYFMMLVLAIPVIFTLDKLLSIWLVEVPRYTLEFCVLILVYQSIDALNEPLTTFINATGRIRNYIFMLAGFKYLNLPLAYILLMIGYPPYCIWISRIIINLITMLGRYIYLKRSYKFPLFHYFKEVMIPVVLVTLLALPVPIFLRQVINGFWLNFLTVGLVSLAVTIMIVYYVGMTHKERTFVVQMISSKLPFIKHKS